MENGIVNITKGLDPAEFEVHCCCLERPGAFVERLPHRENVHVLGKKPGFSFESIFKLNRLISRLKPDLLHSHNLGPLIYSGISSVWGTTCPIVQGEHSLLTPEECGPKRLRQRHWLYMACREIHTVSTQLQEQLLQLGFPREKISVILNGVDTDRFSTGDRMAARQQVGLENLGVGDVVLGIVGRFGAFKRHAVLIDSFNQLASERKNLHLLIVGDGGPEKERVRQQVANSPFKDRIHLAGFQQDVRPYYQAMDLLVVPSENEGMSNAILEGMSCGVPILAHQVCGNSEIIESGKEGRIADLGSEEKLTSELKNVLAIPAALDKMKEMARSKVHQKFSIHSMIEQYAALYRRHARNR